MEDKKVGTTAKTGISSMFTKNAVLLLLIQLIQGFGNNMVIFVNRQATSIGLTAAFIGMCASVYTFCGLLMRAPAGMATDTDKKKIVLVGALAFRGFVFLGMGVCNNGAMFMILRALHGVAWSFVGVALPAIFAMCVDRKVMGTAYAVFSACNSLVRGFARPVGLSLYAKYGGLAAGGVCCAIALFTAFLATLIDFNDPSLKPARVKKEPLNPLKGISWKFAPLCLIGCAAMFCYVADNNFSVIMCDERGIDMTMALSVGSIVGTVMSILIGVICDVVGPRMIMIVSLVGYGIGTMLMGRAMTTQAFFWSYMIFTLFSKYGMAMNIYMKKSASKEEQGKMQATGLFFNDLYSTIGGAGVGALATAVGYENCFKLVSFVPLAAAMILILFGKKLFATRSAEATAPAKQTA
jgi:MFS family permease